MIGISSKTTSITAAATFTAPSMYASASRSMASCYDLDDTVVAIGKNSMSEAAPSSVPIIPDFTRSAKIITVLVCTAHFFSHFFQFLIPVISPLLRDIYSASYAELGLLVSVFYVTSGLCQIPAGMIVDRLGASIILTLCLLILSCAFVLIALLPPLWVLFPAMVIAGIGNSAFHPADYTILSRKVPDRLVGRAFSWHSVAGMAGYATVPVAIAWLTSVIQLGMGIMFPAIAGVILAIIIGISFYGHGDCIKKEAEIENSSSPYSQKFLSRSILAGFGFFAFSAVPWIGTATFMPSTLEISFGTPIEISLAAVTAQLLGSVPGTLAGGWLADLTRRHLVVIASGLMVAGLLFLVIGRWPVPPGALITALAFAGLVEGLTTPSRDKMLRKAAPVGTTGRVFAVAYAGYDLGSALTPALFGLLLDFGHGAYVMPAIAASYAAMILFSLDRHRSLSG